MRRAIYAGSFDPLTLGHCWMIEEGIMLFDELIISIGENPHKKYTFSLEERLDMIKEEYSNKIKVTFFNNKYLVDYAREMKCEYILRGVRNTEDFQYESTLKEINHNLNPEIKTVFLTPPKELSIVSSSIVKSLIGPEGWKNEVQKYVPAKVYSHLVKKFDV